MTEPLPPLTLTVNSRLARWLLLEQDEQNFTQYELRASLNGTVIQKHLTTGEAVKKDDDILHNFILTKNRIKILADQLKTNKQAAKQQQNPYQLVKQIESNESKIELLIQRLQTIANTKEILEIKEEIIKLRKENLNSLAIIKKQVQEQNNQNQPSSPSTPLKPSKKLTI